MQFFGRAASAARPGRGADLPLPSPRPYPSRDSSGSVIGGSRGGQGSRQGGAGRALPPALLQQQRPPAAARPHSELVVIGLSLSPPGFMPSLVLPPPPDPSAAAAARAAAALLRLASAAATRFLQQQLGLDPTAAVVVRRTWVTPGGRVAAHILLPTMLVARAMARKRWRLRGTAFSVDLPRDQVELEQRKAARDQQGAAMAACPVGGGQAAADGLAAVACPALPSLASLSLLRWPLITLAVLMITLTLCFWFCTVHFVPHNPP